MRYLLCLMLIGCGKAGTELSKVEAPGIVPIVTPTPTPAPTLVAVSSVVSTGVYVGYPAINTINPDPSLFMTTPQVALGSSVTVAYRLSAPTDLTNIRFEDNYTNIYAMGDMDIFVSTNSSNGYDGNWQIIKSINNSNNGFTSGDGDIQVSTVYTQWVRLVMTYNGTGAYGGTPSFYLSKIYFYSN